MISTYPGARNKWLKQENAETECVQKQYVGFNLHKKLKQTDEISKKRKLDILVNEKKQIFKPKKVKDLSTENA